MDICDSDDSTSTLGGGDDDDDDDGTAADVALSTHLILLHIKSTTSLGNKILKCFSEIFSGLDKPFHLTTNSTPWSCLTAPII